MKKFRRKPVIVEAKQYTQQMQDAFIALGKNDKQNPVTVSLEFMPHAKLEWNWHINQLETRVPQSGGFTMVNQISVGNYIINGDKKGQYFVCSEAFFEETYEAVDPQY